MIHSFLFLILSTTFAATPNSDFAKYPSEVQTMNCKELDFNSYHKVQNVKGNMLKTNPNLQHPNFAGKYLLLKNDFLFETDWFVADCATGKFIKDILGSDHKDPKTEFKPGSSLLVIYSDHPQNKTPIEYHVFRNEKWMKVDAPVVPTPTPSSTQVTTTTSTPAPSSTPESARDEEYTKYPATRTATECKAPDFSSYHRAESNRKNMLENTPDITHPNFAGHFLMMKSETIFQTLWFIVDCETGKFFPDYFTGNVDFHKDSRLVKFYSSGKNLTFQVWSDEENQWISLKGTNSIQGKTAKALWDSLPHPDKSSLVRFGNQSLQISGVSLQIKSGKCSNENQKYKCEFEN